MLWPAGSAAGFGYLGQWGCPLGSGSADQFAPIQFGIAASGDGVFVAGGGPNSDTVVLVNAQTMTRKAAWHPPPGAVSFSPSLGTGPGTLLALYNTDKTLYTVSTAAGGPVRKNATTTGVAVAGLSDGTYFVLSPGAEPQIVKRDPDGVFKRGWNLIPPIPGPSGFTGAGGGPAGTAYVAGPKGGDRSASVVDIFSLSEGDPSAPPESVRADRKGEFTTDGTVIGIKSTGDGVWTISAEGVLQKFDFFGTELARYDGSIVPGGWGPGGLAADPSGNLYVLDGTHSRVLKVGDAGGPPRTGGGPDSPTLQSCGAPATAAPGPVGRAISAKTRLAARPYRQGVLDFFLDCVTNRGTYCQATLSLRVTGLGTDLDAKDIDFRTPANKDFRVRVKLPPKQLRLVRRAAARHRKAYARIELLLLTPDANNNVTKRFRVRVA